MHDCTSSATQHSLPLSTNNKHKVTGSGVLGPQS